MTETLMIDSAASRAEKYQQLLPQIEALIGPEPDLVANLANISAVLKEVFGFFWVGFYFVKGDELVLGPFQGPVACTRIPVTKGVCGACVQGMKTIIVPDVDQFPGHIACSAFSKSEIVVPLVMNGKLMLVLDVDSEYPDDFSPVDAEWLEKIVGLVRVNPES